MPRLITISCAVLETGLKPVLFFTRFLPTKTGASLWSRCIVFSVTTSTGSKAASASHTQCRWLMEASQLSSNPGGPKCSHPRHPLTWCIKLVSSQLARWCYRTILSGQITFMPPKNWLQTQFKVYVFCICNFSCSLRFKERIHFESVQRVLLRVSLSTIIPALIKPWGSKMFPPPSLFDMMHQIGKQPINTVV